MIQMFSPDSPVISFLGKVADLIIINLLVIICSLPIITIGASWTAMYYVTVKMVKNEESYVTKDFFKSFKQNFRQATVIWLINLIVLSVLGADVLIIRGGYMNFPKALIVVMGVFAVFVIAVMIFVYPVLSHFDNTIRNTIKNSFLLSIGNFPYTVMFALVLALPIVLALMTEVGMRILPVYLLVGITGPAYICSYGWKKIFAKLEPEPELIGENDGKQEEEKTESE